MEYLSLQNLKKENNLKEKKEKDEVNKEKDHRKEIEEWKERFGFKYLTFRINKKQLERKELRKKEIIDSEKRIWEIKNTEPVYKTIEK